MAKPIYLQLNKPCNEQWGNMSPTQQGAYCSSCNKQVIDLTNKTENEVYELVTQHKGELCARATSLQLNTPIRKSELINGWFNWRAMAASLGALLALDNTAKALNPDDKANVAVYDSTTNIIEPDTIPAVPNTLTGMVVDSATNEPLESAVVLVKGAYISTLTDSTGVFTIENASLYKDQVLLIKALMYYDAEIALNQFTPGSKIHLEERYIDISAIGGFSYSYVNPLEEEIGPALDLTPLLHRARPHKNKKHRTKQ